jgi:hypothetical protein
MEFDYRIFRNKEDLDGTGYIEIGPGAYQEKHWQPGFLFIGEHAFAMAEGILVKHFPTFDHFGMNDIPKYLGKSVIADWQAAASELPHLSAAESVQRLNLDAVYRNADGMEIVQNGEGIAAMLVELAGECQKFYEPEEWLCVLGM